MSALKELLASIVAWRIWVAIAEDDIRGRYRRTLLGPFWMTAAQIGFIAGLYYLHRNGFGGGGNDYLPYLAASLPTWGLIAAFLVDGSGALLRAKGLIESYPLPMAIQIMRSVTSSLITFAHLIVVFFIVLLLMRHWPNIYSLAVIPGLILLTVFGLGVALIFGPLGARFRDLTPAINAGISLLFVLTPVFWIANAAQQHSPLVRFNPFFYLLEVVRGPLMGHALSLEIWAGASTIAFASLLFGLWVYARMRLVVIYYL